jgi:hypothetical protein
MEHPEMEWSVEDQIDMYDFSGKNRYFGIRSFIERIAEGNVCFVCGAEPGTTIFNNEHVFPIGSSLVTISMAGS